MQKIVYIIPGFLESLKDKRYERLVKVFKQKEFKVIPVHIDWKYRTMSDYLKQFIKIYNENEVENKVSEVYFFGFSFGAYIAFSFTFTLFQRRY
jgi:alpha-beta hydrolase superfamily lysophospholipase